MHSAAWNFYEIVDCRQDLDF